MRLKGLPRYLSTGLGKIPFEVFDPVGASDEEDSGSYTTGLGLSTLGLQRDRSGDRDVLLNILPQKYSDRQTFRDRTRFLIVAATLLVLLLCGKLADGYIRGSNANKTLDGLDKQFQTLQKLSGEKAAAVAESSQARGRINR